MTEDDVRERIRAFLASSLPPDWRGIGSLPEAERAGFAVEWRARLREAGLLGYDLPVEYGTAGLDLVGSSIIQEEFARVGAPLYPHPNDPFNFKLIGPTVMHWGTDEQRQHFIPRMLDGTDRWAQGFSEPDAGSDLFAVRTTARRVEDEWIVDGQKIWTTAADTANWIFALCRTDREAPKAKGLSFLLIPLDQEGVTVRPIRTMTGETEFCEVFFTGARTRADHVIGPEGQGAKVALTLLGFERGKSAAGQAVALRIEWERLVDLARGRGRLDDPGVRLRLGRGFARIEAFRHLGLRVMADVSNGVTGAESSFLKLFFSEHRRDMMELAVDILGEDALEHGPEQSLGGTGPEPLGTPQSAAVWLDNYYMSRAATIFGGSSQMQRNTIGERILGLEREPAIAGGEKR